MKAKIRKLLRSRYFYYALLFTGLNVFFTLNIIRQNGSISTKLAIAIEVVVEATLLAWLYFLRRKNLTPEKFFLAFAIPLGVLFALILPQGQAPDEPAHLYRAWGISDGVIIVTNTNEEGMYGSPLPEGMINNLYWDPTPGALRETYSNIGTKVSSETFFKQYQGTANYNPICYIPQVLGILVAKLFGASIVLTVYFGRLFNLAAFIIIIYFAIKFSPKFKNVLVFAALLPISLQQAASLSPDALVISVPLFLIAFVSYIIYTKKTKLSHGELALLYILAIIIGLLKIVYLPLLLSYFLIPAERFGSKKAKIIHASIMVFCVLLVDLSWNLFTSKYLSSAPEGANSAGQIAYLLSSPLKLPLVILNTLQVKMHFYISSTFGTALGTLQILLPEIYTYLSAVLFASLLIQNSEHVKFTPAHRPVYTVAFIATFVAILLGLYIQWTPVGNSFVEGVQGRYFLPFLTLIPLIFNQPKPKTLRTPLAGLDHVLGYSIFINVCALVYIFAQNF